MTMNETWDEKVSFTDNLWDGGHTLVGWWSHTYFHCYHPRSNNAEN